jgi:hypothetical protein
MNKLTASDSCETPKNFYRLFLKMLIMTGPWGAIILISVFVGIIVTWKLFDFLLSKYVYHYKIYTYKVTIPKGVIINDSKLVKQAEITFNMKLSDPKRKQFEEIAEKWHKEQNVPKYTFLCCQCKTIFTLDHICGYLATNTIPPKLGMIYRLNKDRSIAVTNDKLQLAPTCINCAG